jgi:hypothetical protein
MDEKSKKKKKLKQKQKQRQKQNQTVIVNVHSGKSTRSQGNPDKPRIQIPPPIHKVYASPIHDLVPQMFSKEGRQATQQTLTQQLEKILQNQEQARQGNVLGAGQPSKSNAYNEPISTQLKSNQPTIMNRFKNTGKKGRPPGALGKGPSKAEIKRQAEEAREQNEELERQNKSQESVMSIMASEGLAKLRAQQTPQKSKSMPPQFNIEQTYLPRQTQYTPQPQIDLFYQPSPSNLTDILINQPSQELVENQPVQEEQDIISSVIPKKIKKATKKIKS